MPSKKEEQPKQDKRRAAALDSLYAFWDKAKEHISWSLSATLVCPACTVQNGVFVPGKAQKDGKCAFCGNTGLMPDKSQRNWATDRLTERLAPAPKAVEMQVEDRRDVKELEKKTSELSDEELDKRLSVIDLFGKDDAANNR